MSILLFCPVRQDAETFELALRSHRALKGVDHRLYVDDNNDEATKELLRREAVGAWVTVLDAGEIVDGDSHYSDHKWDAQKITRLGSIRNAGLEFFSDWGYTDLFCIDSDVIANPNTVNHLLNAGPEILSEVYWSKWGDDQPWLPQVWDFHPYGFRGPDKIIRLREAGGFQVGGLGACTLISRAVFDGSVDYSPIDSLRGVIGEWEDKHFCVKAEANGFSLYADTHYPPFHVYRKEQLAEAKAWYDDGAHPGYFRKHWLTPQWEEQVRRMFK